MALVHYNDLYPSVDIDDEQYNMNLARQIADIVSVEPDAYDCIEMEHIVDCVNCIRDVLALDRGYPVNDNVTDMQFDYIHCEIPWTHYLDCEIREIATWHEAMREIIEN